MVPMNDADLARRNPKMLRHKGYYTAVREIAFSNLANRRLKMIFRYLLEQFFLGPRDNAHMDVHPVVKNGIAPLEQTPIFIVND